MLCCSGEHYRAILALLLLCIMHTLHFKMLQYYCAHGENMSTCANVLSCIMYTLQFKMLQSIKCAHGENMSPYHANVLCIMNILQFWFAH